MSRSGETAPGEDRRRFGYARAGQLWMSDVMYGPAVPGEDRCKRKTYLIAFIDDATQVIPHAAFAIAENTRAFLPVFKQTLIRRGLPQRLFVDNGANYRSHQFALICAKLGVALIHVRPHQPQAKDYVSYCTAFARFDGTSKKRLRFDSFLLCVFSGGSLPGSSYKHSFLSLCACARSRPWSRHFFTVVVTTPSRWAISASVSIPVMAN